MSGYQQGPNLGGHDLYIQYGTHPEHEQQQERDYTSTHVPNVPTGSASGLGALRLEPQHQHHNAQILLGSHGMTHAHSPDGFSTGQQVTYSQTMQHHTQAGGRKRPHGLVDIEIASLPPTHVEHHMQSMTPISPPIMTFGPQPAQAYHSHGLPETRGSKTPRLGDAADPALGQASSRSVVGNADMPLPAPRPRGPKLKFTADDDRLLMELKEIKNLTWKQIADFFPGRSSGTLQVRYCTKLKAKTTQWSAESVRISWHQH